MRTPVYADLIRLAGERCGPIGEILKQSIHKGHVDTDAAKKLLTKAGYSVIVTDGKTATSAWVRVWKKCECHPVDGELKAQGFSGLGEDDAMLAALYGAIREENAAIVVGDEFGSVAVPPNVRQQLETGYIKGGLSALRQMLGKP